MRDWEGTIVARSTPLGHGAVGIVRLSGPAALEIGDAFVTAGRHVSLRDIPERYMMSAVVRRDGEVWDRCLVVRFAAPRSFTGEDVLELHLHGNPLIVEGVVSHAIECGARLATAGEFTMRAVLHGKLDLLQAEAVGEAISAESSTAVRIAQRQLGGELSRALGAFRDRVVHAIASLELELDFAEEGYAFLGVGEVGELVRELRLAVASLLRSFRGGARLRTGPRVILLGRPNAGKSSFFNSVLGYARALVSDVAGTTRDYLEERVVHGGMVIHLVDTAGLRSTEDLLESEGVRRAWSLIGESDLALYLVDASDGGAVAESDDEIARFLERYPDVRVVRVMTKTDRSILDQKECLGSSISDPSSIDRVLDRIVELCRDSHADSSALVSERQMMLLRQIDSVLSEMDSFADAALVSADLRRVLIPLSGLVGETTNEDVLDAIFRDFCIGK